MGRFCVDRLLFLSFFLFVELSLFCQTNDDNLDVVYLKNKMIYRGTIIKNEMGILSLKITQDGKDKIVQFQHFDIDRIEKVQRKGLEGDVDDMADNLNDARQIYTSSQLSQVQIVANPLEGINNISRTEVQSEGMGMADAKMQPNTVSLTKGRVSGKSEDRDPLAPVPPPKSPLREWTREIRGFRGFIDFGYNLGVGEYRNNSIEIIKSVGFQFNPIFYLGAGTSYKLSMNKESALPLFINPRFNLTDHEDINPFWDLKLGYSFAQSDGAFLSTSFGTSLVVGPRGKFAINIGLTYSYLNAHFKKWDSVTSSKIKMKEGQHAIGLSVGFEY